MNKLNNTQFLRRYGWVFLIPVLLFIPSIGGFAFPSEDSLFSDIAISHYPNAVFLKNTLLEFKTIPLWSDSILGGFPFAANPLSGLWYPFGWLALIFPLPLGFNLLVIAHIVFGAIGVSFLIRKLGLSDSTAIFGALAFLLMPKIFAHYGAGHLTLAYAIPWTPWLLLAVLTNNKKWYAQPGLILGLIFLVDVRWAAYAGILWVAWEIFQNKSQWGAWGKKLISQIALAILIAAPLAIPFLEYLKLSTRSILESKDVLSFSLPPIRLLGLIFPDLGGFHEFAIYSGAIILILAIIAPLIKTLRKEISFWFGLVILPLIFSLGEFFPGLNLLSTLPGFSLLRVPPRALFLTGIGLIILAAYALDYLTGKSLELKEKKSIRLALLSLISFSLSTLAGLWFATKEMSINYVWGAVFLLLSYSWVLSFIANKITPKLWSRGVFLILLIDLLFVAQAGFVLKPNEVVLSDGQAAAKYISIQTGSYRVYSPSYSISQQTAAQFGLHLADGVDPMQRINYVDYMDSATNIQREGYSITLPPFADEDLSTSNQSYIPDPILLGAIGVKYIVSEFPLPFGEVARFGDTRIYQIEASEPYLSGSPNIISLTGTAPGVFLPELSYPGWQAWVDREQVEIEVLDPLFSGVYLEEGTHEVVFKFRPNSVYWGLGLGVLGIFSLFVWQIRQRQ
ncbi:MAG: hypothetical protein HON98_03555 [Chloroflexi bacterium]|jgi:hypothetical protein|nr:hypothetical protein [Chloroflexota bacterium]MBT3670435.1 hypothetical protein [Chloroflexota bacterium]MBT4304663.1 hypothetical protein [Chloroflexota bacterium]MBT4534232.1 hypothetical protein [Chloroflexota bacterium]MBT4681984.1 hypothetical protein [Chloroflexota bacterium]